MQKLNSAIESVKWDGEFKRIIDTSPQAIQLEEKFKQRDQEQMRLADLRPSRECLSANLQQRFNSAMVRSFELAQGAFSGLGPLAGKTDCKGKYCYVQYGSETLKYHLFASRFHSNNPKCKKIAGDRRMCTFNVSILVDMESAGEKSRTAALNTLFEVVRRQHFGLATGTFVKTGKDTCILEGKLGLTNPSGQRFEF